MINNKLKVLLLLAVISILSGCSRSSSDWTYPTPTPVDPPKTYTDAEIIEMTQKDALKYFWDMHRPILNWLEKDTIQIIRGKMQM